MNHSSRFLQNRKEKNDIEDDECVLIEWKIWSWTDGLHGLTWRNSRDGKWSYNDQHLIDWREKMGILVQERRGEERKGGVDQPSTCLHTAGQLL